jgi:hypothetical protein
MSFVASNIAYIINVIEDIIHTSKSQQALLLSTGRCDENNKKFLKLTLPVDSGSIEIKIYDDEGFCSYIDRSQENIRSQKFAANNLFNTEAADSFHQALKEIRSLDRKSSVRVHQIDTSVDRASFGLSKEN